MPKSIFESDIEKATSEYNVQENWQLIMDICDRIKSVPNGPKESLKCIMKRVNHPIPHVSMQALTMLSACVNNCGKPFHLEICSRDWTNEARNVITRGHEKVSQKLRELIDKWATDFKNDPQLNLMVQFHKKLKSDKINFDFGPDNSGDSSSAKGKNIKDDVSFKEDLDLAIAMSLQEAKPHPQVSAQSLYPSVTSSLPAMYQEEKEIFKVRALYDFEAAEDNEMTFKAGEIFSVLDNSDQNWWKGQNSLGVGLFPANFVTTELNEVKTEKKVRFADSPEVKTKQVEKKVVKPKVTINEEQLDLTLVMLKEASPNELDDEEETIVGMEDNCREMGVLIEKKMLECSRQKDDLSALNDKFLQALAMYQQLMKEPMNAALPPPPAQPSYQQYTSSHATALQYQPQYIYQPSQYHQYSQLSQGYTSLPDFSSDKSHLYQGNPMLSLHPNHGTPQPSSLPLMVSPSPRQISSSQYSQEAPIFSHSHSLPYGEKQYTHNGPLVQQISTEQYYNEQGQYGQQAVDYSSYGYSVPQNTHSYHQTSVYQ